MSPSVRSTMFMPVCIFDTGFDVRLVYMSDAAEHERLREEVRLLEEEIAAHHAAEQTLQEELERERDELRDFIGEQKRHLVEIRKRLSNRHSPPRPREKTSAEKVRERDDERRLVRASLRRVRLCYFVSLALSCVWTGLLFWVEIEGLGGEVTPTWLQVVAHVGVWVPHLVLLGFYVLTEVRKARREREEKRKKRRRRRRGI